jgi:Flp pilus assembly pilin Flp
MRGEQGQDSVEHELLCTFIARVMISSGNHITTAVSHFFTNVSATLA